MTYDRMGVTQADAQNTTAVVDRLVNDALHEIEVAHEWPWLQAFTTFFTTAGTGVYSVPTDWLRTRYLQIDTDTVMDGYEVGELINAWPDASTRGRPGAYAIESDTVLLRPIPDTAYTVTHIYVKRESDLTSDDQSPLMPASFHACIAEKAAELGLRRSREDQRAAVCHGAYQEWEARMLGDRRRRSGTTRVKVRPGAWT